MISDFTPEAGSPASKDYAKLLDQFHFLVAREPWDLRRQAGKPPSRRTTTLATALDREVQVGACVQVIHDRKGAEGDRDCAWHSQDKGDPAITICSG